MEPASIVESTASANEKAATRVAGASEQALQRIADIVVVLDQRDHGVWQFRRFH
jgi:hypothetical protein